MHKKPEAELLPLHTEIERTLKNLRRTTSAESKNMANQRESVTPQIPGVPLTTVNLQNTNVSYHETHT